MDFQNELLFAKNKTPWCVSTHKKNMAIIVRNMNKRMARRK
jgi:hypothetical protein